MGRAVAPAPTSAQGTVALPAVCRGPLPSWDTAPPSRLPRQTVVP